MSKDGFGNFSRINDAVAVAPITVRDEGYFHIKIMEGVYEEYIVIDQRKSYLMMSGAGINRTIITGNHSSVDGWDTSHLATFSKLTFSKNVYIKIIFFSCHVTLILS